MKSGRWSKEEDNFLIENYVDKGPSYCGNYLNRKAGSCSDRYFYLKETNGGYKKSGRWSKEEDKILLENYIKGVKYCSKLLNRSPRACVNRYYYIHKD